MTDPSDARDPQRAARAQIADFLAARRAKVTPEKAGLSAGLGPRRVAGLRREEVAMLAGISVEYYARLERGRAGDVSASVLEALARALRLDPVEAAHLETLARTASGRTPDPHVTETDTGLRPGLLRVLDLLEPAAAFVRNARLDVLGANRTGRTLYAGVFDRVGAHDDLPANLARYLFCDPRSRETYVD